MKSGSLATLSFYRENIMSVISKIEELLVPFLEGERMELVDVQIAVESGKKLVRVFLDKEGGVTLDDCAAMSDKLGTLIDESGILPDAYVLEVSSPGIDRVLKNEKDFLRFKGRKARISVFEPVDGQRNFVGKILSFEAGSVTIEDATAGKAVTIALNKIARARLEPEL